MGKWANGESRPRRVLRLDAKIQDQKLTAWKVDGREESSATALTENVSSKSDESAKAALVRNFEFRLPLTWLLAVPGSPASLRTTAEIAVQPKLAAAAIPPTSRLRLRFSLWHNRLPVDALPVEGWIELQLLSEWELGAAI